MTKKRLTAAVLACLLLLTACANTPAPAETTAAASQPVTETTGTVPTTQPETAPAGRHILVACFSATGHTKALAQGVAAYLDGDFYEILPETPYTQADLDYGNADSRVSREHEDPDARPALAQSDLDMSQYDTVMIAHPIWWGKAPRVVLTFLESYDFSGKTLVSMCTSASSPLGDSARELQELLPDSVTWLESRRFPSGADVSDAEDWLREIGLAGN